MNHVVGEKYILLQLTSLFFSEEQDGLFLAAMTLQGQTSGSSIWKFVLWFTEQF